MASCKVNLQSQIVFGHVLCLAGKTSNNCNFYKVSLTSEDGRESALTIFVNVRQKEIVINSFLNSQWRESVNLGVPSINSGERFKFYILFSDDKLHIAFNDKHLCKYPVDMNSVDIKSVNVSGEIENVTQIDHRQVFPTPWPPIVDDLKTTAFSSDVPCQFMSGSVIVIRMQVSGAQNGSFFIRLNERGTKRQLFHFNPRFADRIVVVNCQNDSMQWLNDEYRHKIFPFELNKEFQLAIGIGSTCFKVAVDGRHLLTYDFRSSRQSMLKSFTGHHHIFDKLTGFKMFALQGMKLQVNFVDHIQTKEELTFFEIFSNSSYGKEDEKKLL